MKRLGLDLYFITRIGLFYFVSNKNRKIIQIYPEVPKSFLILNILISVVNMTHEKSLSLFTLSDISVVMGTRNEERAVGEVIIDKKTQHTIRLKSSW